MYVLDAVKQVVERFTDIGRPTRQELVSLLRKRKPNAFRFPDDGVTPNNPTLPMVLYRTPVRLAQMFDPAAILEELFHANGWGEAWRNGIYSYLHYHSQIHEVLGIARGKVRVEFGGKSGRKITLKAGDVVVMPAGTGHRRIGHSSDLLVVGAYPAFGKYNECLPLKHDHERAMLDIAKVSLPSKDPVYGRHGPLIRLWSKR